MADPTREEIWRKAAEARRKQSGVRAPPPAPKPQSLQDLLEISEDRREGESETWVSRIDFQRLFAGAEALIALGYAFVLMGPAARWLVNATMGPGPKELSFAGLLYLFAGFFIALLAITPVLIIQQKVLGENYIARFGFGAALVLLLMSIAGPVNRWEPKEVLVEEQQADFPVSHEAIRAAEERERLLSEGPGPHYTSGALHAAAKAGDVAQLQALLSRGMSVDEPGQNGRTALMLAVEAACSDAAKLGAVRYLLESGAAINTRDQEGATALFFADRDRSLIELLAEKGADPKLTRGGLGVWWNLRYADADTTIAIADKFRGIGMLVDIEGRSWAGPLHQQAEAGNAVLVKYFLGRGLSPRDADWRGMTPVHSALHVLGGDAAETIAVLELLIAAGGDVNARDGSGRTPLMLTGDVPEVVQYLIGQGAQVNALLPWDAEEKSVLDMYEYWNYAAGAEILRAVGAKTAEQLKPRTGG